MYMILRVGAEVMEKEICNQYVMYGLDKYLKVIKQVILEIGVKEGTDDCFDIMLIMTEALTNAFKHGNQGNSEKPIYLRYYCNGSKLVIEIEDLGEGDDELLIPEVMHEKSILENHGRGLFIIASLADKVEYRKNILHIEKYCKKGNHEMH